MRCFGINFVDKDRDFFLIFRLLALRYEHFVQGVRLVGSEYPDRGTIEVLHNGRWGTICDDNFNETNADVICRMLGYNFSR